MNGYTYSQDLKCVECAGSLVSMVVCVLASVCTHNCAFVMSVSECDLHVGMCIPNTTYPIRCPHHRVAFVFLLG